MCSVCRVLSTFSKKKPLHLWWGFFVCVLDLLWTLPVFSQEASKGLHSWHLWMRRMFVSTLCSGADGPVQRAPVCTRSPPDTPHGDLPRLSVRSKTFSLSTTSLHCYKHQETSGKISLEGLWKWIKPESLFGSTVVPGTVRYAGIIKAIIHLNSAEWLKRIVWYCFHRFLFVCFEIGICLHFVRKTQHILVVG